MKRISIIFALVALAGGAVRSEPAKQGLASSAGKDRIKLVFVIDQPLGKSIVVNRDTVGMDRIAKSLKPLQEFYDVYCLFGPMVKAKQNLDLMLDICVANKIPFMFDVASSDSMSLGGTPQCAPFDEAHGLEISLPDLKKYKERYGVMLAGIRFMEIFGQDGLNQAAPKNPGWIHNGYSKAPDPSIPFLDRRIYQTYLKYAQDTGMFVQWSDHTWSKKHAWDTRFYSRFKDFFALLEQFPGLITVTYANNEWEDRLADWEGQVKPLVALGAREWGLSDQAWMVDKKLLHVMSCPPEDIVVWCKSALDRGSRYIQFEPPYYFFNVPVPLLRLEPEDYTKDPKWADRGSPRDPFKDLSAYLIKQAKKLTQ